jgi:RNA polymerase sigma-70 factor (ECF subfamily)
MLIDRHQTALRWFLRRITGREDLADDLAQDTFVRVLRHAGSYDPRYPMRTWLFTIARRLSINQARSKHERFMTSESETMADRRPTPVDVAIADDERAVMRRRVQAGLAQLTEPQRAALLLVHQQGMQVDEVAAALGLPVGTVKSHLHRGREALRQILGPQTKGPQS